MHPKIKPVHTPIQASNILPRMTATSARTPHAMQDRRMVKRKPKCWCNGMAFRWQRRLGTLQRIWGVVFPQFSFEDNVIQSRDDDTNLNRCVLHNIVQQQSDEEAQGNAAFHLSQDDNVAATQHHGYCGLTTNKLIILDFLQIKMSCIKQLECYSMNILNGLWNKEFEELQNLLFCSSSFSISLFKISLWNFQTYWKHNRLPQKQIEEELQ